MRMASERSDPSRPGGGGQPRSRATPSRAEQRRRTARQALLLGIAASVLVHLVATLTFRFRIEFIPPTPSTIRIVPPEQEYAGTRVYDIVPVEGEAAPIEAQIRVTERSVALPAAPSADAAPGETPVAGGARRTVDPVGDRLRPRLGHNQVWTEPDRSLPEPTEDERVRMRVAERLALYNDSVRVEAEREARSTDWTVTDASGNRWGISPGKIHLGSLTLPAPGGGGTFYTPPARGGQNDARVVNWQELHAQAQREMVREIFDDRVRAVRARREAERADTARAHDGR
jgi:hypothetical protein